MAFRYSVTSHATMQTAFEFDDDIRLLKNARFRRLLESRIIGQTAQNALFYALIILLVKESGSSVHSTLLVVALTLPSIIFGIPGGTFADILPRRLTLTVGYLGRAVVAAALFYWSGDLVYIYILVLVHSTIGQVFGPAEAATVPAVVRRDQLTTANSLMMAGLMVGQIAGMVVLAPFMIKLISPDSVFLACTVLFLVAAYIVGWLAQGFTVSDGERAPRMGFMAATRQGFDILRTNRRAYLAMVYLVIAISLSKVLVILMPKYTDDVLGIQPEDTVFVVAPAAIGAVLGLLFVPLAARLLGAWRVVALGFALFMLGLIGLGLVVYVRAFILDNVDIGIGFVEDEVGVSSVITVTMLLAIPLGFAFTVVNVAARVVMNEAAPPEAQGRIFAVQMAIGDFLSLIPLLIVGVVADVVGVRATLLASTFAAVGVAGYLTMTKRFGASTGTGQATSLESEQAPLPG